MTNSHRSADLGVDCLVHDLNNVFQTILEAADLISSDPAWASVAGIITRGVEQGHRIVASIVETERNVPLQQLVESSILFAQDFVGAIGGPLLTFTRQIDPALSLNVKASALERALVNLYINSAQASRACGRDACEITVKASLDGDEIELVVADDGPGIGPEIMPLVFAAGFSTKESSSGLGLHIVESVVRANGGSVTAYNGEAGGAVFHVRLPAEQASVSGHKREAVSAN